jgi:3',5'-cyclic-AMP phosphodiesterase
VAPLDGGVFLRHLEFVPIYLPPITRREFLARSLAAGAGVLASGNVGAEETPVDPNFWALYSDTHIAEDTAVIYRGEPMFANALRVNRELFAASERPCGLIHFGDCAFKAGLPGDYATFHSLTRPITQLGIPIHLMVGNHDSRAAFWKVLAEETAGSHPLASRQVAVVEHPRANWFLLDSLEETDASPGSLGAEQCAWLEKELDAHADKPALVCVHHNPQVGKADKNSGLLDTDVLLKIVSPRRHIKALIFGHTHTWRLSMLGDLHLINLPAVGYPSKSDSPTGWVEAHLGEDEMRLLLHSRDTAHRDHLRPIDLVWRKA